VFTVDVGTDQIDKTHDCIQQPKRLCRIASALGDKCGQMFLRFRKRQFRDKERYVVRVVFKDSPDPGAQYSANQYIDIEHECSM
jgi:hypothetical protein